MDFIYFKYNHIITYKNIHECTHKFFFSFSCVSEYIQGHKIVDECTFLRNVYVKCQDKTLVRKSLTELLHSDFGAVIIVVF